MVLSLKLSTPRTSRPGLFIVTNAVYCDQRVGTLSSQHLKPRDCYEPCTGKYYAIDRQRLLAESKTLFKRVIRLQVK